MLDSQRLLNSKILMLVDFVRAGLTGRLRC